MNPLVLARAALADGRLTDAVVHVSLYCRDHAARLSELAEASNLAVELDQIAEQQETTFDRCRVAILGDYASHPFAIGARCALLADRVVAHLYEGEFGAWQQQILDDSSGLYAFRPDVILLAVGTPSLTATPAGPCGADEIERRLNSAVANWQQFWNVLERRFAGPVLQHSYEAPAQGFVGTAERLLPWAPARFIDTLNCRLLEQAPRFVRWIDMDRLAERAGRRNWHNPRLYYYAKQAFDLRFLPDYVRALRGSWRSATGRIKKVLVTDLDNTLWGGVIGDDGLDGIALGEGTPEGEAFAAFGRYLKSLQSRGVILAVCSKNDLEIAKEVFTRHSGMPLQLDDFAAFRCNWEDKASNLRAIADELNVDISGLVMADDNAAECDLVRQHLPEVTVIELSEPSQSVRLLDEQQLFDAASLSAEDLGRAASYAGRRQAIEMRAVAQDLNCYLISLEMRGATFPAKAEHLGRLAQMELKTNQFNLTARRYSGEALARLMAEPAAIVMAMELSDRFAHHGVVGSLIAVREGDAFRIDEWLLSCRVFSRTAEHFMLSRLIDYARAQGAGELLGEYLPTAKNRMVADLYARMGFVSLDQHGRWWRLSLRGGPCPMHQTFIQDCAPANAASASRPSE